MEEDKQNITEIQQPLSTDVPEFVPQSTKEFIPQSVDEFIPQEFSVEEFIPHAVEEFIPQSVEEEFPIDKGYGEYYDQMDGYMNNLNLGEQSMSNAQRLDAYFYNRQVQQPFPRQVVRLLTPNYFLLV